MAILSYSQTRIANVTEVAVVSDLSGTIYYHWYLDGAYVGMSQGASRAFALLAGEQARIDCVDSNDADFDAIVNAPDGWPARRTFWWIRSMATDVDHYRVEIKRGLAGGYVAIGTVKHESDRWAYSLLSPRLDDGWAYDYRIHVIDTAGNALSHPLNGESIVRRPDAPAFSATFDDQTSRVTFAAA